MRQQDLMVDSLGECRFRSPLHLDAPAVGQRSHFIDESTRIRFDLEVGPGHEQTGELTLEEAGPREALFFEPSETTAAIVTCGGLSPGLNNVIRSVCAELSVNYRAKRVLGIRNGYLGLNSASGLEPVNLDRDFVGDIDQIGGTVLGSSRGAQEPAVMADFLASAGVDILFCLGGDGTQRGAFALHQEIERRDLPIAIVGIPKTIDNDIAFVDPSFGFATALDRAAEVIRSAHVEARGTVNGIGLVKLMGRDAGFIAAGAAVISQEVNFVLIPEIRFPLEGGTGLLAALEKRMRGSGHAVIAVAEGAGQYLFAGGDERRDASGNVIYQDIGLFLRDRIRAHFAKRGLQLDLKYIDPSYYIRSVPANTYDRFLSDQMGRHAVHAAMAGKTGMVVGRQHDRFINVPIPAVVGQNKRMEVTSDLWRAVLQVTRQPRWGRRGAPDDE